MAGVIRRVWYDAATINALKREREENDDVNEDIMPQEACH